MLDLQRGIVYFPSAASAFLVVSRQKKINATLPLGGSIYL